MGLLQAADGGLQLTPEAFLKGPARPEPLVLATPDPQPECQLADLRPGQRALLILTTGNAAYAWPDSMNGYVLKDGHARLTGTDPDDHLESGLISDVRSVTNLYAVPATNASGAEGIDWMKTVVPVGAALLLVFGIGLLFMRTWHRIDPT